MPIGKNIKVITSDEKAHIFSFGDISFSAISCVVTQEVNEGELLVAEFPLNNLISITYFEKR